MSSGPCKRSPSPLSRSLDDIIRIRLSNDKKAERFTATSLDHPPPQYGQEVLSLSPTLQKGLKHEAINDLILGTTLRLAREGRRLVRAPRLLADGIAFDWKYDNTARDDDLKALLSVQGIRAEDLEMVLLRATPAPGDPSIADTDDRSGFSRDSGHPPTVRDGFLDEGNIVTRCHTTTGHSLDPIVIDDDEAEGPRSDIADQPVIQPNAGWDLEQARSFQHITPNSNQTAEWSLNSSSVSSCDADVHVHTPYIHQPESLPARISPPHAFLQPESHGRSSAVSYATRQSGSPVPELPPDFNPEGVNNSEEAFMSPKTDNGQIHDPSRYRSIPNGPSPQPKTDLGKRKADWGEWKIFGDKSSDIEMDAGHPASRESSPSRTSPSPPAAQVLSDLPFLPRAHNTSNLPSEQPQPKSASRSVRSGGTEPYSSSSSNTHSQPSSRRVQELSRRRPNRPRNPVTEYSSRNRSAEGPLDCQPNRRWSVQQHVQSSSADGSDASEDHSDVSIMEKVQNRTVSLPRSNRTSCNLRKHNLIGSHRAPPTRSNASDSYRKPRSPHRSASVPREGYESSSEDDEGHAPPTATSSGHTEVIPKADYARGRRLLVPVNPDNPMTAILMRGDAHFIDQRRKSRISTYSLPVEDYKLHVEDACLIGDDTVVVGYNKGPYQVSLIPVEDDQRPSRIDLKHKAHSTVIENRSAGRSYSNPGIACLAPVTGRSFLSGGHDKTVYHWKIARLNGRGNACEDFSVSSVRIPTRHSQAVQALAYCAWSESMYSAAGDRISTTKLSALAHVEPERVSGKITQIHVHPQDPRLIALEIDHMDDQVHFYDMRKGGFSCRPWLKFGYRPAPSRANRTGVNAGASAGSHTSANARWSGSAGGSIVPKPGSRYTRGSTVNSLFARGYGDGVVLIWDCRNGAKKKVLERFRFQRPAEVAHTVLAGSDVIAYGEYSVTFWSMLTAKG